MSQADRSLILPGGQFGANGTRTTEEKQAEQTSIGRDQLAVVVAVVSVLLLTIVYLPGLHSFFSSDDWAFIAQYRSVQPSRVWEYFSPAVLWFYRPLQAAQFGLYYHWFGLDEVPYNLSLLAMHLGVCWLGFLLLRDLTRRPMLAAGAVAIFAGLWVYVDILLWKSNFNTEQWALLTLAACFAFTRHLRTGEAKWRGWTYALCLLNLFAKEAAVSTPILLFWIWLWFEAKPADLRPAAWRATAGRLVSLLGPTVLIAAVYVALHGLVRDVSLQKADYTFASPGQALRQILVAYNHLLLSFHADPVILPSLPPLQQAAAFFTQDRFALPLNLLPVLGLIGFVAWRTRDRLLAFGLGWVLIAFVPMVFLTSFHTSRFYYLPALGAALILARLFELGWTAANRLEGARRSALRSALMVSAGYLLVANVASTLQIVLADRDQSAATRGLYSFLESRRGELEPGCLVVLRNAPETFFGRGLGAPEMVRLALADPAAEAAIVGQPIESARKTKLQAIRNVYVVDVSRAPLQLQKVPINNK
jgi:hypothetical protein